MLNKLFIQTIVVIGLLFTGMALNAEEILEQTDEDKKVFRKFHADGVVEFSDQPSGNSEELKMEELPTYKFGQTATPAPKSSRGQKQPRPVTGPINPYSSLTINSPGSNETIRANNGNIEVKFNLVPKLLTSQGHKFEYVIDGKSILKTEQAQTLKNLDRGSHSLVIQVIDKNNKVLIHSDSVSFHLKRFFKSSS